MGTVITGAVLLGIVGWIIRGMLMKKKKGKPLCCGDCCGCGCHCGK